jgi:hypothetical protein
VSETDKARGRRMAAIALQAEADFAPGPAGSDYQEDATREQVEAALSEALREHEERAESRRELAVATAEAVLALIEEIGFPGSSLAWKERERLVAALSRYRKARGLEE